MLAQTSRSAAFPSGSRGKLLTYARGWLAVAGLAILSASSVGSAPPDPGGGGPRQAQIPPEARQSPKFVPNELLVKFRPGIPPSWMGISHAAVKAEVVKTFAVVKNLQLVRLPAGMEVEEAIARYQQHPEVLYAEPNYMLHADVTPNDPRFNEMWGLHNTAQAGGTADADIDAPEAWDLSTGSTNVVVAVIDTGIDFNHEDLAANMFRNQADCNNNGSDDDGNGFIDDCFGIDAVNDDSNPMDDNNHGSHVAGTIGAVGNNGLGVTGVNWTVKLMACKFLSAQGGGPTSDAIECLNYLAMMKDRGVNIVATNNSWGGPGFSQALRDAIDAHRQRGILFIAAAGNDGDDTDETPHYPSSFFLPNVIAVAATTQLDSRTFFSNFGRRSVHLGAPGNAILSTTRNSNYGLLSGTSMATPHVTGVAALLKAENPARDWKAIKNLILAGGDTVASMADRTVTGKRLNAHGAMTCVNSTLLSRLRPINDIIAPPLGTPVTLAALHINCALPNGNVQVSVNPGGQTITLLDAGLGPDQAAGDGIYSGQWTPPTLGTHTLTFPGGDVVTAKVLRSYNAPSTPAFNYRNITGTNLNFGDDSSARILSPFPILFGGESFTDLFVSANGNINFIGLPPFDNPNQPLSTSLMDTVVAPFWDDLFPVLGKAKNVFWEATGSAPNRELVVEWRNVKTFDCSGAGTGQLTVKFQVVFFEGSSDILFNYADTLVGGACTAHDQGASATVGVQVASTVANQFSFNTPNLSDNTALLWQLPVNNPAPTLTSLLPASALAGGPDFTLTLMGSGFVSSSVVRWKGSNRPTSFVNSNQVTATVSASDILSPGTANVTVFNPTPGGGQSAPLTFTINTGTNPAPTLTSLSPSSAFAGDPGFTLTVTGSGFVAGSGVRWNGADRPTTFLSNTQLTAPISASDIASAGSATVTVFNPAPGGGTSSPLTFTINAPLTSAFKGKVRDKNLLAVADATVSAFQGGVLMFSTTSGSDGKYLLSVAAGTYDLVASKPGFFDKTRVAQSVAANQTQGKTRFKLRRHSFFVGTVQDASGNPLAGALVEAVKRGVVKFSTTTAADGSYSLLVIAKTYKLRASMPGFQTRNKKRRTVSEGGTTTVNFNLTP
ncbi:MAG: S8 family serine peptidase [Terriglobia bacterium]